MLLFEHFPVDSYRHPIFSGILSFNFLKFLPTLFQPRIVTTETRTFDILYKYKKSLVISRRNFSSEDWGNSGDKLEEMLDNVYINPSLKWPKCKIGTSTERLVNIVLWHEAEKYQIQKLSTNVRSCKLLTKVFHNSRDRSNA